MSLYDRIFKPRIYTLPNGTGVEEKRSRAPLVIVIVALLAILSIRITGFDLSVLVTKGGKFFDILKAMFPPNTAYLGKIWQPLWDTIKMSFLGSFIGAVLAIPFAIAASSNIVTNRAVVFLVRLFLSLVRTLPTLVCALIATYIFGLGTMAGTCAIAVFTFAYVGKQLFEIIETVDMGPYEAMEAQDPVEQQKAHYLDHVANSVDKDTIDRVCGDLTRKLAKGDRLIGPALACLRHGRVPYFLARGAAMALYFVSPTDKTSQAVQDYIAEHGVQAAIQKFCGLSPEDPAEKTLLELITGIYYEIGDQYPFDIVY